jgi:hypothetical protein
MLLRCISAARHTMDITRETSIRTFGTRWDDVHHTALPTSSAFLGGWGESDFAGSRANAIHTSCFGNGIIINYLSLITLFHVQIDMQGLKRDT